MRAIYMKSVRSPLMSTKYRMVREKRPNMNIFSQVQISERQWTVPWLEFEVSPINKASILFLNLGVEASLENFTMNSLPSRRISLKKMNRIWSSPS
jgi:hypothetical protein